MQLETIQNEQMVTSAPIPRQRRYDVDWLRTLALGLLILYHVVVSFQSWAFSIGFIQNYPSLDETWILMSLLNVWRIPILFLISGMGVRFAMERRDWKQLLKDRTVRILLPFVFGFFFIAPISYYIYAQYYQEVGASFGIRAVYLPNPGHLWFLANIFVYVLVFLPVFTYFKNRPDNLILRTVSRMLQWPGAIFLFALPIMLEAWLVNPDFYSAYAMTAHGFWLGLLCFFIGYVFIAVNDVFWSAVADTRRIALVLGLILFLTRFLYFAFENVPNWLTALESMSWMLAILGFGSIYLNKPSSLLRYLSKAVYPVYIIHLPIQYALSYWLLPSPVAPYWKLLALFTGTLILCLLIYELILKRINWIRPLFGMKLKTG